MSGTGETVTASSGSLMLGSNSQAIIYANNEIVTLGSSSQAIIYGNNNTLFMTAGDDATVGGAGDTLQLIGGSNNSILLSQAQQLLNAMAAYNPSSSGTPTPAVHLQTDASVTLAPPSH